MDLWLTRTLSGFSADESDSDTVRRMKRIPLGTTVQVELRQPRSVKELRYYWQLCSLVALNHEQFQTREQVDQALRILTGHCDVFTLDGRTVQVPKRIAFHKLSQEEWRAYLLRAKDAVIQHLLPGVQLPEIEAEISRMAA
mgnify:CR=1 FL=1